MPLEELKDIRPPVELPADLLWLVIVLGLLFLVGCLYLIFWLRARFVKRIVQPLIIRPAWETALEEIAALEKENLPASGKGEEYFVQLSAIVRHYLERRFDVNAPEMTTDEFLIHVKTMPVLESNQKVLLKEFLILSDMVKFARHKSTLQEMGDALNAAKRLINETIPVVVTSESSASLSRGSL